MPWSFWDVPVVEIGDGVAEWSCPWLLCRAMPCYLVGFRAVVVSSVNSVVSSVPAGAGFAGPAVLID